MNEIKKDMTIGEIIEQYPSTIEVFVKNGMRCIGCGFAMAESLEMGAKVHGINLKKLLKELNEAIKETKK